MSLRGAAGTDEGVLLPLRYPPDLGHRAGQEGVTSCAAEQVGCLPTGDLSGPQSSL